MPPPRRNLHWSPAMSWPSCLPSRGLSSGSGHESQAAGSSDCECDLKCDNASASFGYTPLPFSIRGIIPSLRNTNAINYVECHRYIVLVNRRQTALQAPFPVHIHILSATSWVRQLTITTPIKRLAGRKKSRCVLGKRCLLSFGFRFGFRYN